MVKTLINTWLLFLFQILLVFANLPFRETNSISIIKQSVRFFSFEHSFLLGILMTHHTTADTLQHN